MRRLVLVTIGWVLLVIGLAAPASAHAVLIRTDPVEGQVFPVAPSRILLEFNEHVDVVPGQIRLLDSAGRQTPLHTESIDQSVHAHLPVSVETGTYLFTWRVVSADGHPISGAVTFSIGAPGPAISAAVPADDTAPGWLQWLGNGLVFLGLLTAGGLAFFRALLARAVGVELAGIRRVAWVSVAVAGIGYCAVVVTQLLTIGLQARTVVEAGLAVGGVALATATRGWISVVAAVLGLGALALTGHPQTAEPKAVVLLADVVHVGVAGLWLGGLSGLLLLLIKGSELPDGALQRVVARFSQWALITVGMAVLAGVVLTWRILGSWSALFGTTYGWTLCAKVILVGAALALGAYNRYRFGKPTLLAEIAVLVTVVAVTAGLVMLNPHAATSVPAKLAAAKTVDGLTLSVSIDPGKIGSNHMRIEIRNNAGVLVAPLAEPVVEATIPSAGVGPIVAGVHALAPGSYMAMLTLAAPGHWQIVVRVRISQFQMETVTLLANA